MNNYTRKGFNKKSIDNLSSEYRFKGKWNKGGTTVVRVPESIKDEVLYYARMIDEDISPMNEFLDRLGGIVDKVDSKVTGYKSNSASQLIKDIRALLEDC